MKPLLRHDMMTTILNRLWYTRHPARWMLWPFSLLYQLVIQCRRVYLKHRCHTNCSVPIIVVGNLTVGGVGKTPLVVAIARACQARGLRVGIVSRGYGARITQFPYEVKADLDEASVVGDEPLLLARKTGCPVVIAPKRNKAVHYLLKTHQPHVIISDDGLQHHAMERAIEVVVIDGQRGMGNGLCLPAGPLREPVSRLKTVDFIVVNGGAWPGAHRMDLQPGQMRRLSDGLVLSVADCGASVAAITGIGHPERFFETLQVLGVTFKPYVYPDHHAFQADDLIVTEAMVVMTEKDAVKCESFATETMVVLPVEAQLNNTFWDALWSHESLRTV